jgi:CPA1 family monovalent cation:H+ antiporter
MGNLTSQIQVVVLLFLVVAAVAVLAARLKTPPAILMVVTGVLLALVPGLPTIELAPELVLLIVLPPVIYSAAFQMSWLEFWFNLRPITLLAVGSVLFTAGAVAVAAHWLLNLSWGVGFVLGAIIAPPDAVAPLSIARRLRLPRRILVVLEGEGLANDATALILYRFAIVAVSINAFSPVSAVGTFAAIVVGEILWGVAIGWATLHLRRWVNEPRVEIIVALLTPFIAYWPPQHLGGSGVLATLVTGLYASWNGLRLISSATRLQGIFFWDLLIYLIEGMIFLITGLQARTLFGRIAQFSLSELLISAAVISAVVIIARFVWIFPATYIPRWLSSRLRRRDPSPPWQWVFVLSFTGVRGIVSLAAALAIPLTTSSGQPFPDRDLILLLTFSVILVTLVGLGLLLPSVIRALGLAQAGDHEQHLERDEEHAARRQAIEAVIERLEQLRTERGLSDDMVEPLRARHQNRLRHADRSRGGSATDRKYNDLHDDIELTLIAAEREHINTLFRNGKLKDEARRRIERELDLREAHFASPRASRT